MQAPNIILADGVVKNRQVFQQTLQHWVAVYSRSDDASNDAFTQIRLTVRDMESQKIFKPIIFYQIMMVFQALTVVASIQFTEVKIKKIMALLYPDDSYVTELTAQVISAISQSDHVARNNPENIPIMDQLRERNIAMNANRPRARIGPPSGALY